jgi:hypothetical protein
MPATDPVTALLAEHQDAEAVTVADATAAWAQVTVRMRDGSAFYIHAERAR